ncbi:hypothetical protein Trydic_g2999 [Trypoxylus dichotomus]
MEFCNHDVRKVLKKHGIYHRVTIPYTPEQNGAAEQENRTLAEAVSTAAYAINRSGSSAEDGKSPYELWYNKTPYIDRLRSFGTDCYAYIPKQKRSKFEKKAIKGQVVGYCADKDGYRIWISENDDIILSRDIIFHEETEINSNAKFVVSIITEEYSVKIDEQESGEAELKDNTGKEIANNTAMNLRNRDKLKKPAKYTDFAMLYTKNLQRFLKQ